MAPPLFIVGTSRSGTSWAFDLLASHPDMSMGYESKLPIEGIEVYRRHSGQLGTRVGFDGLFEALAEQIDDPSSTIVTEQLSRAEVRDRAFESHRAKPGWAVVCEEIFRSVEGTTNWGNKFLRVELTPTIIDQWPEARFVVLTRDPRGVMASQAQKFDHSLEYSAMYWNTHANFVLANIGGPGHDMRKNHLVIDLVDMARDPRPVLEWAFSEVGLSTEPVAELIERFPGDPERLDKWRETLDEDRQRRIEEYCFDAMGALGYVPELATRQRNLGRVARLRALVREHGMELLRDPGSIRRKHVLERATTALRGRPDIKA